MAPKAFAERLQALAADFEQAYARNTLRTWRADWHVWSDYCQRTQTPVLPATVETLRAFLKDRIRAGRKRSTLQHYLATLSLAHRLTEIPWPLDTERGRLMWRAIRRSKELKKRQRQVDGLTRDLVDQMVDAMTFSKPADVRDAALLYMGAETMCRRSELASLHFDQLSTEPDGTGRIVLEESKTDQEREGAMFALSEEAMEYLQRWLEHAEIQSGPLFRSIPLIDKERHGDPLPGRYGWPLSDRDVARIYKKRAKAAGINPTNIAGHSTRVGATQDLLAANFSGQAIMKQARWKSERMVVRYGEKLDAGRGAMAQFLKRRKSGSPSG